ncbi:MAG TPA: arginine--tRNA ligase [Candidatus Gastranaerophilales bacterium]|nr:arginine--tRNA ligase [Candidatus Gastranaerophilales bacterium]
MLRELIKENFIKAVLMAGEKGELTGINPENIEQLMIEKPKNTEFGDFAVNISPLAKYAKIPPAKIAEIICNYLDLKDIELSIISGFINFKIKKELLNNCIKEIIVKNNDFGSNNIGNSEKVLLEYVSANPTGPLHIGHGRWAAVGSSLANLLKFSGYNVFQEFYINDAGNQINNLGKSLWIRVLQELGEAANFPEDEKEAKNYYPGDYLIEIAKEYLKNNAEKTAKLRGQNPDSLLPSEEIVTEMSTFAKQLILEDQKRLLSLLGVNFDRWFPETSLHKTNEIKSALEKLKNSGKIYEKEEATWFKSSDFGDDQDRVIIKHDGNYTYLTADIAYHYDKLERGFERLINIWGADHHGYVARIKAAIQALGKDSGCLEVLLGQLVNLIISGEQVRMGKRRKMVTLQELVDDVGVDGTRYWMIMRDINTTLDFDIELAKSCSDENPVYYSQYAHARACSILRTAVSERPDQENKQILPSKVTEQELKTLFDPNFFDIYKLNDLWKTGDLKELDSTRMLILRLESFDDILLNAAKSRAPYMIARYIQDLAKDFHYFYTFTRVLNVNDDVMKARLVLIQATKQVLSNAFKLLGVSAPEKM